MLRTEDANHLEYWKNEAVAFLALASIKGVGFWTLLKVAQRYSSFKELLKAPSPTTLSESIRVPLDAAVPWEQYQIDLWATGLELARTLHSRGIRLIFNGQNGFPENLKRIPDAPQWLFVQGSLEPLHATSVAVVGTRKPSGDGIFLTKLVVASLAHKGLPTVSGLATGIDQLTHLESLRYGVPTVAVLGNGVFVEYPKGANEVKDRIVERGGTVISEYLPDQSYSAANFIRRNRLQAALCQTLIPIEWQMKSGTAHTIRFAEAYGKKVAAVYLPLTYGARPELAAIEAGGAQTFELPGMIEQLLGYVIDPEMSGPVPEAQRSLDL